MSPDDFGKFKKEIEKLCTQVSCSYEVKKKLNDFILRLDAIKNETR